VGIGDLSNNVKDSVDDFFKKVLIDQQLKERRTEALGIIERAIRYLHAYLCDYNITVSRRIYKDHAEVLIRVDFHKEV